MYKNQYNATFKIDIMIKSTNSPSIRRATKFPARAAEFKDRSAENERDLGEGETERLSAAPVS